MVIVVNIENVLWRQQVFDVSLYHRVVNSYPEHILWQQAVVWKIFIMKCFYILVTKFAEYFFFQGRRFLVIPTMPDVLIYKQLTCTFIKELMIQYFKFTLLVKMRPTCQLKVFRHQVKWHITYYHLERPYVDLKVLAAGSGCSELNLRCVSAYQKWSHVCNIVCSVASCQHFHTWSHFIYIWSP